MLSRDSRKSTTASDFSAFYCFYHRIDGASEITRLQSIRMVTGHTPGSLFNALGIFASLNINVLKLESRPIFGRVFEYCFYLDFAGNLNDPDVQEALRRLQYDCVEINVFGNYKAAMDYM
jgi:chorismate mutase/prephenate dehydratase